MRNEHNKKPIYRKIVLFIWKEIPYFVFVALKNLLHAVLDNRILLYSLFCGAPVQSSPKNTNSSVEKTQMFLSIVQLLFISD